MRRDAVLGPLGLTAGIASLAGFAVALALYAPAAAASTGVLAVLLLAQASPRRLPALVALAAVGGFVLWAAFLTPQGYFWLNRHRLEALVAEIGAVPAITVLAMGQDGSYPADGGEAARYDSYRFLNGQRVTHYRARVAPEASQPVRHVEDVLRGIGVPVARYHALRGSLARLGLVGYDRGPDGQITLHAPVPGGAPWDNAFVYRPDGGPPDRQIATEIQSLAPHWSYVFQG